MNSKEADIQEEVKFTAQHKSTPAVVFVRTIFFFYIKILTPYQFLVFASFIVIIEKEND